MPQYPSTSEDTVLYEDKQFIAAEDITLRVIDEAIASIYGRVFLNGVEIFPTGVGGVSDGDKGDITVTDGGTVWTIDNSTITNSKIVTDAVSNSRLANMPANTIKGNNNASTADPQDLTAAEVTAALNLFTATLKGLVPPPTTATGKYLKDDGTWAVPAGGGGLTDGDKGDITVGGGGTTLTVDNKAITYAKIQDVAADQILGRQTAGAGVVETIPCSPVSRNLLNSNTTTIWRNNLGLGSVDNTSDASKPVSTAQQTALNAKVDKARTIVAKAGGANTALLTDDSCYLRFAQSNTIFTIPPNSAVAFPIGATIEGTNLAGAMTIAQGAAVTINKARTFVTAGAFSGWSIIKVATDTWDLHGDFV